LADRFVAWAIRNDPADTMTSTFGDVLEVAGLPTTLLDHHDKFDVLLDELFAVADELDGPTA
jgi:hypothetical protein